MDTCLSLPFDQYQRNKLVSDIINKFRTGEKKFKILDVGAGFEENLKKFLPLDDIYCLDKENLPEYSNKGNFIIGDILVMEFKEKYDFVVAVDVYEHIPKINRKKFIDIIVPLSEIATIIAAPFDQGEVRRCELFANEVYRNSHGSDYIGLKEHIENGLPSLPYTLDLIKIHHLNSITIPNGYLPRWFEMISTYLLTENKPEFQPMMTTLSELYNQDHYQYDNRDPAYRQIIVIPKGDRNIDFSDLAAKNLHLDDIYDKNQLLGSFIEKIKQSYQIYQINKGAQNQAIIVKDARIQEMVTRIQMLERGGISKDEQILEISAKLTNLNQTLAVKDDQIQEIFDQVTNLNQILAYKDEQLEDISFNFATLNQTLAVKDDQIQEMSEKIQSDDQIINAKKIQIEEIYPQMISLESEITQIKYSISYQLTMKFHQTVIERFFPQNMKIRKYYDLGIKDGRLIVNEGFGSFLWNLRQDRRKKTVFNVTKGIELLPVFPDIPDNDSINQISKKVSIVIPTKNAGDDFSYTLEKIRNQKGVLNIEIIIVDSGSTDSTLFLAEKYGALIINIAPEEFNHGETRNLGASKSDGDYLVFMVQDAIPIGEYWLYNMVRLLEGDEIIAAVSCRQVPRSDADLFACFCIWYHYSVTMDLHEDIIYTGGTPFTSLPIEEERRRAGLENVSCCIKTEIFNRYRFNRVQSSEDLDLGFRLLQEGYKTAFMFSNGVIHSHNRDPSYFFKRSYVDVKTVSGILGYPPQGSSGNRNLSELVVAILILNDALNNTVRSMETMPLNISPHDLISTLKRNLLKYTHEGRRSNFNGIKGPLDEVLESIKLTVPAITKIPQKNQINILMNQYLSIVDEFGKYLSIYSSLLEKNEEFLDSTFKLFALIAGASLAQQYLAESATQGVVDNSVILLDSLLCRGV